MVHSKAGSHLKSKTVPLSGVNDPSQLRPRYACTPLRSWLSHMHCAQPYHEQAFGIYEVKNSASPPLTEPTASWLSLYVMWWSPIALVDRAAGGPPHRKGTAERREDLAGIVYHPL